MTCDIIFWTVMVSDQALDIRRVCFTWLMRTFLKWCLESYILFLHLVSMHTTLVSSGIFTSKLMTNLDRHETGG